ncbi:hypothetical protein TVAG_372980 [Trichomonas vaginalis G3]|uniref:Uncharacterized protein n=1 Tax=Trichomonas vaginalis (strain ATCC PRA-98 / G3) TaxID=412133 RepID=A2DZG1_TRIV3|nr:hypothetical protein TVAGG3_0041170 [Trichomonas vaginalis G3]EAY14165.1 hypothetical protein TVAG_372980 [Trichomonas vaginalis G3]KAI5540706.1 hypothetical protein TVAGG3_0041170 [Trichomonas vaginalis G3]|eukprot:XP_001326388.1 hypothetical protein [Trichomonas vaginalis G3]
MEASQQQNIEVEEPPNVESNSPEKETEEKNNEIETTVKPLSVLQTNKKKIIKPKPKSALEEALAEFNNPTPFLWQQSKPKKVTSSSTNSPSKKPKSQPIRLFDQSIKRDTRKIQNNSHNQVKFVLGPYKFSHKENVQKKVAVLQDEEIQHTKRIVQEPKEEPKDEPQQQEAEQIQQPEQNEDINPEEEQGSETDDESMFLTQVSQQQTYKGTTPVAKDETNKPPPNNNPPQSDLKYDKDFDVDKNISRIPNRLLEMVNQPHESLTFHALCGSMLPDTPNKIISRVTKDLKGIFQQTMSAGLITESAYVQNIIDALKAAHSGKKKESNTIELKNRLDKAQNKLNNIRNKFKAQEEEINAEKEKSMIQLDDDFQIEAEYLDKEWQEERTQNRFNKPSAHLINLRNEAKVNLKAHRFEEAALIAQEVAKLEEQEAGEAGQRMAQAYNNAANKLRAKYENEFKVMDDTFEMKKRKIAVDRERAERPLLSIMEKLNAQIKQSEQESIEEQKRIEKESNAFNALLNKKIPQCKPIKIEGKLKLPPLQSFNRSRAKSAASTE